MRIDIAGRCAREALAAGGEVCAAFRRSFYLRSPLGAYACIGEASLGRGPLNAIAGDFALPAIGERISVSLEGCETWRAPAAKPSLDLGLLRKAKPPEEGFGCCIVGRRNALARHANAALEAVDRWLAAIRFSQHLAQGGTLISLLSAQSILVPTLRALANEASRLSASSRASVATVVRRLPETAFDWADAMRREESALATNVRLKLAPNVTAQDLGTLRAAMPRISDAMQMPPDRARTTLAGVNLGSLPFPSPIKVNDQREVIRAARQRVLEAVVR